MAAGVKRLPSPPPARLTLPLGQAARSSGRVRCPALEDDHDLDNDRQRLRGAARGIEGIAGCPFLVFYGDVSEDSDGPIELCRPVAPGTAEDAVSGQADTDAARRPGP